MDQFHQENEELFDLFLDSEEGLHDSEYVSSLPIVAEEDYGLFPQPKEEFAESIDLDERFKAIHMEERNEMKRTQHGMQYSRSSIGTDPSLVSSPAPMPDSTAAPTTTTMTAPPHHMQINSQPLQAHSLSNYPQLTQPQGIPGDHSVSRWMSHTLPSPSATSSVAAAAAAAAAAAVANIGGHPLPFMGTFSGTPTPAGPPPSLAAPSRMSVSLSSAQDDKREKRLARNRESARQSRRRKKQYLELLEEKVAQLTEEIDGLRRMHFNEANTDMVAIRDFHLSNLERQEDDREQHVEQFFHLRSIYSEEQQAILHYQFNRLKELVVPSHYRFLMWLGERPPEFYPSKETSSLERSSNKVGEKMMQDGQTSCGSGNGLWPLLCHELGMTSDQEEKVKKYLATLNVARSPSHSEYEKLKQIMRLLEIMKQSVEIYSRRVQMRNEKLMNVLSATQMVKYLSWVQRNRGKLGTRITTRGNDVNHPAAAERGMAANAHDSSYVDNVLGVRNDGDVDERKLDRNSSLPYYERALSNSNRVLASSFISKDNNYW